MADIFEVGVVGSGIMGAGLAEVAARAGHHVVVRSRTLEGAEAVMAKQMEMAQLGLPIVQVKNIHRVAEDYSRALGRTPELDWTDPATLPPPPPPPPDPAMVQLETMLQIEREKRQAELYRAQLDKQAKDDANFVKQQESSQQIALKAREQEMKEQTESGKQEIDAQNNLAQQENESLKREIEILKLLAQEGVDSSAVASLWNTAKRSVESTEAMDDRFSSRGGALAAMDAQRAAEAESMLTRVNEMLGPQQAFNVDIQQALRDISKQLSEMNNPKDIVRDEKGRVIQIGNKRVERDKDGKATRIT